MLILYPQQQRWMQEVLARRMCADLAREGIACVVLSAQAYAEGERPELASEPVLLVNLSDMLASVPSLEARQRCLESVRRHPRRVLVNLESTQSSWFHDQFRFGSGVITEILDLGVVPQTAATRFHSIPLTWIPDALTRDEVESVAALSVENERRAIPWAMVGQYIIPRRDLLKELRQGLGENGFVFLPSLRQPTDDDAALPREVLGKVLSRAEFSVWQSFHEYPHHEPFCAVAALIAGAMPVKIDPRRAVALAGLPWVFGSVCEFLAALADMGKAEYARRCRDTVLELGTLGQRVAAALGTHGGDADAQ